MRNQNAKRKSKSRPEKSALATPVSMSKHSSTRQIVHDGLSSGTQASVVSQSPQAKEEHFFPFHPPNRKALKHPGWSKMAAETIGSTLDRTTRVDPFRELRTSRIDENWSPRADTGH